MVNNFTNINYTNNCITDVVAKEIGNVYFEKKPEKKHSFTKIVTIQYYHIYLQLFV